jgi:hypothetical protein
VDAGFGLLFLEQQKSPVYLSSFTQNNQVCTLDDTKAMMTDHVGESLLSFKPKNAAVSGNRPTNSGPKVAVVSTEDKVMSMKGKGVTSSEKSTKHKQDSVPTVTESTTPDPDLAKSEYGIEENKNADNLDVVNRRVIPGFVTLVDPSGRYFLDVGDRRLTRENNKVGETLIDVVNTEQEYQRSVGATNKRRKVDQTQSRTNPEDDTSIISRGDVLIQQCCHEVSTVMVPLATKVNETLTDSECEELFTAANVLLLEQVKASNSMGYRRVNHFTSCTW